MNTAMCYLVISVVIVLFNLMIVKSGNNNIQHWLARLQVNSLIRITSGYTSSIYGTARFKLHEHMHV